MSLLSLTLTQVLTGPYLVRAPLSRAQTTSLSGAHFSKFANSAIFSSALLNMRVHKSGFVSFQNSAVHFSGSSGVFFNCSFTTTQVVTDGDRPGDPVSKATFTSCLFCDCSSPDKGGAILSNNGVRIFLEECDFVKCTAQNNGGALYVCNNDDYVGDFENEETLPSLQIKRVCFSECAVLNCPQTIPSEDDRVGYVMYTKARQVKMSQFAAMDCARDDAKNAYMFFGWINLISTSNANLTIGNSVPEDLGAFSCRYIGRFIAYPRPKASHKEYYFDGFKCQHVWRAHMKEGYVLHELTDMYVLNSVCTGVNSSIFYVEGVHYRQETIATRVHVFNVENSDKGAFWRKQYQLVWTGHDCTTNIKEWADGYYVTYVDHYGPIKPFANVECNFEPRPTYSPEDVPETEVFVSDSETQTAEEVSVSVVPSATEEFSYSQAQSDESEHPTSSTSGDTEGGDDESRGSLWGPWAIVGTIVGVVVVFVIAVIITIVVRRRQQHRHDNSITAYLAVNDSSAGRESHTPVIE